MIIMGFYYVIVTVSVLLYQFGSSDTAKRDTWTTFCWCRLSVFMWVEDGSIICTWQQSHAYPWGCSNSLWKLAVLLLQWHGSLCLRSLLHLDAAIATSLVRKKVFHPQNHYIRISLYHPKWQNEKIPTGSAWNIPTGSALLEGCHQVLDLLLLSVDCQTSSQQPVSLLAVDHKALSLP